MIEVCAHMNDKSHIAAMQRPASAVPKGPPVAHTNDGLENEEATTSDAEEPAAKRVQQDRLLEPRNASTTGCDLVTTCGQRLCL